MRIFVEHDRDEVLLAAIRPEEVRVRDVILAEISPGRFVLHRVLRIDATGLTLQGDGNVGTTEHCRPQDVVGIARGFYRKGRNTPDLTNGWKWRTYSHIWLALTPIRRYLLAAYRRLWLKVLPPI